MNTKYNGILEINAVFNKKIIYPGVAVKFYDSINYPDGFNAIVVGFSYDDNSVRLTYYDPTSNKGVYMENCYSKHFSIESILSGQCSIVLLREECKQQTEGKSVQQQVNELKDVIVILQEIDSQLFFDEITSITEKVNKIEEERK